MTEAIRTAVAVVIGLLVDGSYETVEAMTRGRTLSAGHLREAVEGYGRKLTPVPHGFLDRLDVVRIEESEPAAFHVVVDLWTEDEGRSDLSLELRLTDLFDGAFDVEILGLHVL